MRTRSQTRTLLRALIAAAWLLSSCAESPDESGFYDTGDLGYVDEAGAVYVTGRLKDLVIVGGRNIYPSDLETVAAEVPGVYPGRAVAFGVPHRGLGTEALVVLFESESAEAELKALPEYRA